MDTKIKRFLVFQLVLILTAALLGQVGKASMSKCGIQDVRTLEQLYQLDIDAECIFTDEFYDGFIEYMDSYVNEMVLFADENHAIIAIVKPTGTIRPYNFTLCQEVIVEQVTLGDKNLEQKTLSIYSGPVFMMNDESNVLECRSVKNVMQPGHTYLAFFSPAIINDYLKEDIYQFNGSFFEYLDLTNDSSVPIKELPVDLRDVRDIEFFTSSQRTLDAMLEIKQRIIEKYIK